jgi:predicted negative regulator of RcsB-dependent stress response
VTTDRDENETGQSRRARRRAAQQDAEPAAETEERASEAGDDGAELDAVAEKPVKATKKKKSVASAAESIRDRNQRLREEAAARRRAKREKERGLVQAQGLDASEMVDDTLARSTHAIVTWTKKHFAVLQWVIVGGIAVAIGWQIYSYNARKQLRQHSEILAQALEAERARVGAEEGMPDDTGLSDIREAFPNEAARLKAAAERYEAAIEDDGSKGAKLLAKLGLASVLYEQGKYAEARDLYEQVKNDELVGEFEELRGRALEGIGLSLEAKADKKGALKAFGELANAEIWGFDTLALYHQARLHHALGDDKKAKELLTKAQQKLEKQSSATLPPSGYLEVAVRELLGIIDPSAVAAAPKTISPEQIQRLQEQIGKLGQAKDPKEIEKLLEQVQGAKTPAGGPAPAAPPPAGTKGGSGAQTGTSESAP